MIFSRNNWFFFVRLAAVFVLMPIILVASNGKDLAKENFTSKPAFIENKGQIIDQNNNPNSRVLYLLNTPGMNVQLRRGGFSYDLYRILNKEQPLSTVKNQSSKIKLPEFNIEFHRIDFELVGSNPSCEVVTTGTSTDYENYYTTGTPVEGVTSVHSYGTVTYKDIYPGIDVQFLSAEETPFKYNFVVHPGARIDDIRIDISGPEKVKRLKDGLHYETRLGEMNESIPRCYYQTMDGEVDVNGRFYRIAEHLYGFRIEEELPQGATVYIDPVPTRRWGTYYGGEAHTGTQKRACSTDGSGNIIVSGGTGSTHSIATAGAYQVTIAGMDDAFLVKFNPDGQRIWGTYYGGSSGEYGYSCAVDRNDNIILSGYTFSTNNIASPGAYQTVLHGTMDGILVKFTPGGQRIWGTYYGGNEFDPWAQEEIEVCAVDTNGNIYCEGITNSPDYIASPGAHQSVPGGMYDHFLVKFSADGQRVWGTYYGGSSVEVNGCCTVSNYGVLYLSGNTGSPNNISTPGSFMPTYNATQKTYLAAFDLNGQRLWGTYYAGENDDYNEGCLSDTGDNVYIYGTTNSITNMATPGSFQETPVGGAGGYLAKFNSSGIRLWGTYYGTNGTTVEEAAVDDSANVIIAGSCHDQNSIIPSPGAFQSVFRGGYYDSFLGKFNANGQRFWGTYYGGTSQEGASGCAVDHNDNIYLWSNTVSENNSNNDTSFCSRSNSYNYIATPGAFLTEKPYFTSVFLVKFSDCYSPDTALQINGPVQVCANESGVSYSIAPIVGASDYHWCVSNNLTITSGQSSTGITVDVGPITGTDTISVYGINSCDNGYPKIMVITVVPRPIPVITGTDTICTGDTAVFYTSGGMINYTWAVSPGGTVVSGGTPADTTISITWSTGGYQWVSLNLSSNGCQSLLPTQKAVWVVAGPAVSVTITPTANPICSGTTVTFTAVPLNEGTLPLYQWKVNGISVGANNTIYSYTPVNGDVVQCILTSNLACESGNPAASNSVTMVVNPILLVSVSVSPSLNPICAGTLVTLTATPTYGGLTPSFQWKVNGGNVGTNSNVYSYIPNNGDVITCTLTSSETCTTGNPAISNQVTMTVTPILPVSISISPSSNPFCPGGPVTFTANPVNEGLTPQYQWKVNGINVGTNSSTYIYNPVNGDQVSCELNSSIPCPVSNPVTSNTVTMIQNNSLPAGVTIAASVNPFCPGSSVTFTATPTNGGSNPSYQWKVNGINAGTNSSTYSYNPIDGDSVRCIMNSNLACVTNNPVSSLKIIMSGTLAPVVTFNICFDSITTLNAKPIFLKGGIPLGGVYSGPGVNSITGVFNPALAGIGTKTITYSYTNAALCSASKVKTIIVQASAPFTCGNNLTDIRDNKVYPTVQIGGQCWFASDLNYGVMISSTQNQRDNCLPERYQNSTSFYQWDELMLYNDTQGLQGLCPPGWHVPTENDWNTLFTVYTNNAFAGSPLKYSGYSGFNALLTGANHINVQWDYQNFAAFYWSSTPHGTYKAWAHGMNDNNPSVSFYPSLRSNAFSVRCLHD